jgi:hypothetical protein
MKVIPERVIERCYDCSNMPRYIYMGVKCLAPGGPVLITTSVTDDEWQDEVDHIHPDCPLADTVSDPCHQDPKFSTNAGRSCATASCPFKYEDGHTYESCPYGKEANDVDAEKD